MSGRVRIDRVHEETNHRGAGHRLVQNINLFCHQLVHKQVHTCGVSARMAEAAYEAKFDGVGANKKHNWSCGGSRFGGKRRNGGGTSDHSYSTLNEVGRHRWQSILVALRPTEFDRDVLALNVAGLGKAPDESRNLAGPLVDRRSAAEIADNRHRRLLRPRR